MKGKNKAIEIGERKTAKCGIDYIALGRTDSGKILVEFQDEWKYQTEVYLQNYKNGSILNPYSNRLYGVGYRGAGKHMTVTTGNAQNPVYTVWHNMLRRCYYKPYQERHTSYIGCSASEEWFCFQNFAEWWDDNCYTIEGERMELDKDLLVKNNKVYCPERCCILPQRINLIFPAKKSFRNGTPPGVQKLESGKFMATCGIRSKSTESLGVFDTAEDAFRAYKERKEKNMKEVADQYKSHLPQRVYDALYNWKIEITD